MPGPTRTLGALALLLLAGCSSYKSPTFRVTNVQLREQNDAGTELLFVIEAANPNGREIPLHEAKYALTLDGERVFRAVRSPEATLRRYATQEFVLPVAVDAASMPPGERVPYRLDATITYVMPGAIAEILFDRELRRPKSSFSDAGTLDFGHPGSSGGPGEPGAGAFTPAGE